MSRRRPPAQRSLLAEPIARPPSPELEAVIALYAEHEPWRRTCEARHWLEVTGANASRVHALAARIAEKRGQAAADQLLEDMRRIQRARRYIRDGVTTAERVAELRARIGWEQSEVAAEALIEAMRQEWRCRSRWW